MTIQFRWYLSLHVGSVAVSKVGLCFSFRINFFDLGCSSVCASGGSLMRFESMLLLVLLAMDFLWFCSPSLAFWLGLSGFFSRIEASAF